MDWANVALTVILSSIALVAGILKGVQLVMRNMLVAEGLIRPGRTGESHHWPNGWHNLPDTLQGLHEEIQSLRSESG